MTAGTEQERLVAVESAVGVLTRDVAEIKTEINSDFAEIKRDLRDLRDKMTNRLPVWATILISVLTAIIGTLAGIVASVA